MNSEQSIRSMRRKWWKNIYRTLRNISRHDVTFSDPALQKGWDDFRGAAFQKDPHGFIIRCSDPIAEAIWQAVERRMD